MTRTRQQILSEARDTPLHDHRWDELFAEAADDPTTRDELNRIEYFKYLREESRAGML